MVVVSLQPSVVVVEEALPEEYEEALPNALPEEEDDAFLIELPEEEEALPVPPNAIPEEEEALPNAPSGEEEEDTLDWLFHAFVSGVVTYCLSSKNLDDTLDTVFYPSSQFKSQTRNEANNYLSWFYNYISF